MKDGFVFSCWFTWCIDPCEFVRELRVVWFRIYQLELLISVRYDEEQLLTVLWHDRLDRFQHELEHLKGQRTRDFFSLILTRPIDEIVTFQFPIVEFPSWCIVISIVTKYTQTSSFQLFFDIFTSVNNWFSTIGWWCCYSTWDNNNLNHEKVLSHRVRKSYAWTYLIFSDTWW